MFVLCVVKYKRQIAGQQNKHTSTDEVQTEYKRIQKRKPREGEIFRTRPDRPSSPPSLLFDGQLLNPGGKSAGTWR